MNSDNCCSCLSAQKTFIVSFWHSVCDWRILMLHLSCILLQTGCWQNGGGQCQWMEPLQLKICNSLFSGCYLLTCPFFYHQSWLHLICSCHSKEHSTPSKSCSFLPWRCSKHWLEMLYISEGVPTFIPFGFNIYLFDQDGLLMNIHFPVLF